MPRHWGVLLRGAHGVALEVLNAVDAQLELCGLLNCQLLNVIVPRVRRVELSV